MNITWPIQVLRKVVGSEQVVDELLRVLRTELDRLASFKPEKKLRSLQLLADYPDDPRVTDAGLACLSDFDSDVRFEAAKLLGLAGTEEARGPLLDQACSDTEDSERVRQALLQALYDRGFSVVDRKDDLVPLLGDVWRIGPKGSLIVAD
jgi:HEAT repeat protein